MSPSTSEVRAQGGPVELDIVVAIQAYGPERDNFARFVLFGWDANGSDYKLDIWFDPESEGAKWAANKCYAQAQEVMAQPKKYALRISCLDIRTNEYCGLAQDTRATCTLLSLR